jgi:transcriptional regulator with XRE-family HTH domain
MKIRKWKDIKHLGMSPRESAEADHDVDEEIVKIRLCELREAEGITHEEMAQRASVDQIQISRSERRANPQIDTIRRYLAALGYDLELVAVKRTGDHRRVSIDI